MIWTIISTIGPLAVIVLCLYNNHLQKQTWQLSKQTLREIDEHYKAMSKTLNVQTRFNDSAIDNIELREETLRMVANYIKAGEDYGWVKI